jgi:RNA polymerase sigma-70 factor (TIGR02943 family)
VAGATQEVPAIGNQPAAVVAIPRRFGSAGGVDNTVGQTPPAQTRDALADPAFTAELRRQMLRFATLQLSDPHLAEDAVQEALIGALRNSANFGGRAAYKSWVFAILRHKIADVLRERQRSPAGNGQDRIEEDGHETREFFDDSGHWTPAARPAPWGDPTDALREAQFWVVFEACLDNLPGQQARLFMMREFVELESSEICAAAGITLSNLNVSLHRARLKLRRCLEHRWFAEDDR